MSQSNIVGAHVTLFFSFLMLHDESALSMYIHVSDEKCALTPRLQDELGIYTKSLYMDV